MSGRYGEKTRVTEAASKLGRNDPAPSGVLQVYEQEFTSPGTWTWPGKCSYVDVLLVGGGGGGVSANPVGSGNSGSGGGVAVLTVSVSAPVPITVGSGGAAGTNPANGSTGGTSAFGPLTAPIPSNTLQVGGGQGGNGQGQSTGPTVPIPTWGILGNTGNRSTDAGRYGSSRGSSEPLGSSGGGAGGVLIAGLSGANKFTYGAGGQISPTPLELPIGDDWGRTSSVRANSGMGGRSVSPPGVGSAGSSGVVIVRWYE